MRDVLIGMWTYGALGRREVSTHLSNLCLACWLDGLRMKSVSERFLSNPFAIPNCNLCKFNLGGKERTVCVPSYFHVFLFYTIFPAIKMIAWSTWKTGLTQIPNEWREVFLKIIFLDYVTHAEHSIQQQLSQFLKYPHLWSYFLGSPGLSPLTSQCDSLLSYTQLFFFSIVDSTPGLPQGLCHSATSLSCIKFLIYTHLPHPLELKYFSNTAQCIPWHFTFINLY